MEGWKRAGIQISYRCWFSILNPSAKCWTNKTKCLSHLNRNLLCFPSSFLCRSPFFQSSSLLFINWRKETGLDSTLGVMLTMAVAIKLAVGGLCLWWSECGKQISTSSSQSGSNQPRFYRQISASMRACVFVSSMADGKHTGSDRILNHSEKKKEDKGTPARDQRTVFFCWVFRKNLSFRRILVIRGLEVSRIICPFISVSRVNNKR